MIIAVNTRPLLSDNLEGYGYFIQETFRRITQQHPEHTFLFIFDRPFSGEFIFGENVKAVVTGPAARHPLLWKFWYDFKVPAILKKYKADVFVSCDGGCSLTTKVPQCLVVHDLSFLQDAFSIQKSERSFYKRHTPKFLAKASTIATLSAFSRKEICNQYAWKEESIDIVYSGAGEVFAPLTIEEKNSVKEKYTEGREYFVYTGAIHPNKNLVHLLKAFSVFKKKQKSGMKLVLAGPLAKNYESFAKDLQSYKYRDDVVMTGYLPEAALAAVTGAAYAMVYPSLWEGFSVAVLEAIQAGVPVILSDGSAMQEVAGDAALYANGTDYADIAEKMIRLYKDENMRATLIKNGQAVKGKYSWDKTADGLWKCIQKAVG